MGFRNKIEDRIDILKEDKEKLKRSIGETKRAEDAMCKDCTKKLKRFKRKIFYGRQTEEKVDAFMDKLCDNCRQFVN